jgi:non-specific protein-tyrosine kinase
METENDERSTVEVFLEYVNLLWRWTWLLVIIAVVAGVCAYYISQRQTPIYESSTLVLVSGAEGSQLDSYSSVILGQQLTSTYSLTMVTGPMVKAVSDKLGYPVSAGSITVNAISNTNLIHVTVTNTEPQRAADIANTLVNVFAAQLQSDQTSRYADSKANLETEIASINAQIDANNTTLATLLQEEKEAEAASNTNGSSANQNQSVKVTPTATGTNISSLLTQITQIQTNLAQYQQSSAYLNQSYESIRLAEAQSSSSIIQEDPAVANKSPIQPQPVRSALLSAIVGLLLGAGIIFLIEFLDDTIRDPQEITRKWGVPILGLIAHYSSAQNPIIASNQPRSPVSESYRSLRTNLQFAGVETPLHTLLVTSASPEDGKTSVVTNLATVLAQNDRNVVVIDGDLRRPRIHKVFQLSNHIGLTDYFLHTQDKLNGVIKKTNIKGLSVITSGGLPPNPSELLNSEKMFEAVHILAAQFNMVLIDTPPLLAVTDALVLSPRVDGVILVIDPNKTKRAAVRHAIEQLRQVKANLIGIVLNNIRVKRSQYYYYQRGYYYGKEYGRGSNNADLLTEVLDEKESTEPAEPQKE